MFFGRRALPFCCRGHHRFVAPSKTQRTRAIVGLTALFLRPLGVQKGRLLGVQKGRGGESLFRKNPTFLLEFVFVLEGFVVT